jgi:hypothetical protein
MRDLSDWLGIAYEASLLVSTFNGIPYVVTAHGTTWSGPRPQKAGRTSRSISRKDRVLLYTLFYENFLAWNYPCPQFLGKPVVRFPLLFVLILLPTKMEFTVARAVFKRRLLPSLRLPDGKHALRCILRLFFCRLAINWLLLREAFRRLFFRKNLLKINHAR